MALPAESSPSPDRHFSEPRLASIYDDLDPDRSDLDVSLEQSVSGGS